MVGAAAGSASPDEDHWAFYVSSQAAPVELRVLFQLSAGTKEIRIPPTACLRNGARLAGAAWFVLPTLGPKRSEVRALQFEGPAIPLN